MFKSNGGFTLVELIVVIAILAILSSIAIPAYSGYIEKAEAAKDDAQIRACKTALVAACSEIGEDPSGYTLNYTYSATTGLITGVTITGSQASAVAENFEDYIEGNGITVSVTGGEPAPEGGTN